MPTDVLAQTAANLEAQRRMGDIVRTGEFDRLHEVFAPDVVDHDPAPDQPPGSVGIGAAWASFRRSFPDVAFEAIELVATEEFVSAVLEVSGTHLGEFLGHAPTGRTFRIRAIQVGRFLSGRMTDRWVAMDQLLILQQLGLR